jgi:hypothetical protein
MFKATFVYLPLLLCPTMPDRCELCLHGGENNRSWALNLNKYLIHENHLICFKTLFQAIFILWKAPIIGKLPILVLEH